MNTTMNLTTTGPLPATAAECQVTATTPEEMASANRALVQWCEQKIATMIEEARELKAAYEEARRNHCKDSTLKRHWLKVTSGVGFYQKVKRALELGFNIIPNFPVTCFAVRTERTKPAALAVIGRSWSQHEQKTEALPEGKGEYKNPFPEIWERDLSPSYKPKSSIQRFAEKWRALDFPINMAKPLIMELTSRAMALKLFDDFGVLPSPYRQADPVVLARIRDPRSPKHSPKFVSFIIAWHLDTRTL